MTVLLHTADGGELLCWLLDATGGGPGVHLLTVLGRRQHRAALRGSLNILRPGLSDVDEADQPCDGHRGEHPRFAVDDRQVAAVVADVPVG